MRGQRAEPLGDLDTFQVTREGLRHSSEHNAGLLSSGATAGGVISAQCSNPSGAPTHNPQPDFPPLGTPGLGFIIAKLYQSGQHGQGWRGQEGF